MEVLTRLSVLMEKLEDSSPHTRKTSLSGQVVEEREEASMLVSEKNKIKKKKAKKSN